MTATASTPPTRYGMTPGSIVYTGKRKVERVSLDLIRYDASGVLEDKNITLDEALSRTDPAHVYWLNINGLHDTDVIRRIGERFDIHPLILEDIVHPHQRPKVEYFERYLFVVMSMIDLDSESEFHSEQFSMILGEGFVLTFQEQPGDVFEPVRDRIRNIIGRICKQGADYLAYALMDVMVDTYFAMLETYGDAVEDLEDDLLLNPKPDQLERITRLKRETLYLRRAVWPLREVVSSLLREDSPLIQSNVRTYFRDIYDHVIQVIDTVETQREILSGLHDFYLSSLSFKMNEVVKVLTIISTIFIPLSFLAGVYGMNFDLLPELHLKYGYFYFWAVVLVTVAGMLWYFRRKKWI